MCNLHYCEVPGDVLCRYKATYSIRVMQEAHFKNRNHIFSLFVAHTDKEKINRWMTNVLFSSILSYQEDGKVIMCLYLQICVCRLIMHLPCHTTSRYPTASLDLNN